MTELENEIKALIIESLELEDISIEDIKTQEPLFGEGLGLDSIDALELGLALKNKYAIHLEADSDVSRKYFYSVESLVGFVQERRQEAQ